VVASYTDSQGTPETRTSSATAAVANVNDAPTGSVTIAVNNGHTVSTLAQGDTLTASNTLADVDGIPTDGAGAIAYQWKANGTNISGATSSTYTLTQAEVGKAITVVASYTDSQGTPETSTSSATSNVANVNDAPTGSVSIAVNNGHTVSTLAQGDILTASNTLDDIDGIPGTGQPGAISYRWRANGVDIVGATNATYALTQAEVGKSMTVQAVYTDQQGRLETVESTATGAVIDVNDAPTGITLQNLVGTLLEDSDISSRIKLADVVVTDDTVGTNQLSLSGADADRFELEGTALYFRPSDDSLDFEVASGYTVQVSAADAAFPAVAPVSVELRLLVGNVVETETETEIPEYLGLENEPDEAEGDEAYENWLRIIEDAVPTLNIEGAVEGDGNGDGVSDDLQEAVASRPFVLSSNASTAAADTAQTFVTLVAESTGGKASTASAALSNIRQDDAPSGLPEDIEMPLGILRFDAAVSEAGKTETFSLYVNAGLGVTGYWKQDASNTWVNLASAPYGGTMAIEGGRLRLDFRITDGGEFDNDGLANGIIADPGALGVVELSLAGAIPVIPAGAMWF